MLEDDFHTMTVHYGFMEQPNIPRALLLEPPQFFPLPLQHDRHVILRRQADDRPGRPLRNGGNSS